MARAGQFRSTHSESDNHFRDESPIRSELAGTASWRRLSHVWAFSELGSLGRSCGKAEQGHPVRTGMIVAIAAR